jgi:hypothetical protein
LFASRLLSPPRSPHKTARRRWCVLEQRVQPDSWGILGTRERNIQAQDDAVRSHIRSLRRYPIAERNVLKSSDIRNEGVHKHLTFPYSHHCCLQKELRGSRRRFIILLSVLHLGMTHQHYAISHPKHPGLRCLALASEIRSGHTQQRLAALRRSRSIASRIILCPLAPNMDLF